MTDELHAHRSVPDWVLLLDNVDDQDSMLTSCPRAREAWSQGLEPWVRHVFECSECREVAKAQEIFADDQLRPREALALLEHVERFYETHDETHEAGRIALQSAHVLHCFDRPGRAAEVCIRAARALDPDREPHLPVIARNNAVQYLVSAGETERARALFDRLPPMPEPIAALRRLWVEADLLRAEERYGDARTVYERVRTGFAEAGLHYDAALAALDLAVTAHREKGHLQGAGGEIRLMVEEATLQLTLAGARPETFAALRLLLQSVREEAVTLTALDRVRRRVETLRPS